MSERPGSNIPGWAIVLGFIFCWPVGLVLLFLNLGGVKLPVFGGSPVRAKTAQAQAPQNRAAAQAASGAQVPGNRAASGEASRSGALHRFWKQPKAGTPLTVIGAILTFFFGVGIPASLTNLFSHGFVTGLTELFPLVGFLGAGVFLLYTGISKTRLARRMKLYQGVIGQRNSVFLSDLAVAAGVSEAKVISDLQRMLSDGYLPLGYIDRASGRLVLTDQGYEPPRPAPARTKGEDRDAEILKQIRQVNDAIPGEEMSRKIARIEEITGKILDYQRKDPAKAPQLRQFLNYYLPTTLKILNAYAQMDAQGVDGENITAAKRRIEGMMDKVVEGFEKQLDQLFQSDAMDIATDVDVLEQMLERDGLGSGGITMGG